MKIKKIVLPVIGAVVIIAGVMLALSHKSESQEEAVLSTDHKALEIWYTDEAFTDYLGSAAVDYQEKYGIRVRPVLKPGKEFLETILDSSLSEEEYPDLFLTTNDTLEQTTLSGLTTEILDEKGVVNLTTFPETAVNAVSYKGKVVAYPLSYNTSIMLYNRTYLDQAAAAILQAEKDAAEGEAAQQEVEEMEGELTPEPAVEGVTVTEEQVAAAEATEESQESPFTEEEIQAKAESLIPSSLTALAAFSDEYDAPEQVENVFYWDVADILYNYDFVGGYMNVGGECGDNEAEISLYNPNTVACMQAFQELNQQFSIDADTVKYDSVLEDFMLGKSIFTVVGVDAIGQIEKEKEEGVFPYEYGVCLLPDVTEDLHSRSLSITTAVCVNGFSQKLSEANAFAAFLTTEHADDLYTKVGQMPCKDQAVLPIDSLQVCRTEYQTSISMPKMMATANLWMRLEIGVNQIWKGADVDATLKEIEDATKAQLTIDNSN